MSGLGFSASESYHVAFQEQLSTKRLDHQDCDHAQQRAEEPEGDVRPEAARVYEFWAMLCSVSSVHFSSVPCVFLEGGGEGGNAGL